MRRLIGSFFGREAFAHTHTHIKMDVPCASLLPESGDGPPLSPYKRFDPKSYGLSENFFLTSFTKMKG